MLLVLLGAHAAAALVAACAGRRLGRGVFWLCAAAPAATVAWAATAGRAVIAGEAVTATVAWAPSLGLEASFRVDAFSLLMVGLIAGIGVLVFAYAFWYFAHPPPGLPRFAALLVAFAGAMLGLVTADNLLLLFVFWELTSITSYLLIGFEHAKDAARAAALQALLVTGAGGLALLGGFVILAQAAGSWSLHAILADPPSGPAVTAAALCVLAGVATKSAQVPFHSWLPGAMAAPTPVSAYLHSATMVKAGLYVAARLAPLLAAGTLLWQPLAVTLGVVTMLVGGWRALRQHDLKLVLAYGTVSQLGFMFALLAAGTPEAAFAGVAVLLAHGLFKAALFMVVGVIDHEAGTRDLRRLSGLGRRLPGLCVVACVAAASMAGVAPLAGFVAKEEALGAFAGGHGLGAGAPLWLAGVLVGSVLTAAYSFRFCWGAFATKRAAGDEAHAHVLPVLFWAPAGVLAATSVVLGVAPGLASPLVEAAAVSLNPHAHPHALALWHGLSTPLLLSAGVLAAAAALVAARDRVEVAQARLPRLPGSHEGYQAALQGVFRLANRVASVAQCGSLPTYLAVILTTAVAWPAAALLAGGAPLWQPARLVDSPLQVVALAAALAGACGAVAARRRFAAVLALGCVGYATVALFALHGAPDLALTQLLVETLGVVAFILALRHLPARFEPHPWRASQALRATVACVAGVFVTGLVLVAGAARTGAGVSSDLLARALPEAGGHNVVNVILVDFRGMDTLGEVTVLAVAALGIATLVRAARTGGEDGGDLLEAAPAPPARPVPTARKAR